MSFLDKETFDCVSLFNGLCDISLKLVLQKARSLAEEGLKYGWLKKLEKAC